MLLEKGILTEEDISKLSEFSEWGTVPFTTDGDIEDTTPIEENAEPTCDLLELARIVNEEQGKGET